MLDTGYHFCYQYYLTVQVFLLVLKIVDFINSRHSFSEFVKPASSKGISIEDIHLSSDDLEMYIDLAPFLNPSPYVVPEDMSLTKVIIFFLYLSISSFYMHGLCVSHPM